MEDERGLKKIMDFMRLIALLLVVFHLYYYCYWLFEHYHLTPPWATKILERFTLKTALFASPYISKGAAAVFLLLSCLGTRGKPNEKQTLRPILAWFGLGILAYFGSTYIMLLRVLDTINQQLACYLYIGATFLGFLLLLRAGNLLSRRLKNNLMNDVFNKANESFPQEERKMENEWSVNLPTKYTLRGKERNGYINIVNPFRAVMVYGTPGSGKSFAIINPYIKQHLAKGFAMYVYDYKYPDLSKVVYNELVKNQDKYPKGVSFHQIVIDNPTYSNRCNPLQPELMTDIMDASESAATIMLNLNKTWIQKQGDFFVESPINFVASIIWFLKLYQNGRYCTFPHMIEFLGRKYSEMFPILSSYPEIENLAQPFISAFEDDAMDQLSGQIASARIGLSRLASPALYWILSGNDFTLDLNNPEAPKVLCVANNPQRKGIYAAALGLINARIVRLMNKPGKLKSSVIVDELPTMYFKGLDDLIAEARSNKVACCLSAQTAAQLDRDYGKLESAALQELVGTVIAGQQTGDSAEKLSKRFGRILQQRQSLSVNSRDTSTSISTQLDSMIPASTISNLSQGVFVGAVADNWGEEIDQKVFHARVLVDADKIKKEEAAYEALPMLTDFTDPLTSEDCMIDIINANYKNIKKEIGNIVDAELIRIQADPLLRHLIKAPPAKKA